MDKLEKKLNTYLSLISTDSYYPALRVLYFSWKKYHTRYPFVILLGQKISDETIEAIEKDGIKWIRIEAVQQPKKISGKLKTHHWLFTFEKLALFEQIQYNTIVFLDADMIVLSNLDALFERPHLSAVNAGGHLQRLIDWTKLNSGLMVIEPKQGLSEKIFSKIVEMPTEEPFSDQHLINAYYPNWPQQKKNHLSPIYNVFAHHVDEYVQEVGLNLNINNPNEKTIKVIHFASKNRPWLMTKKEWWIVWFKNIIKRRNNYNNVLGVYGNILRHFQVKPNCYLLSSEWREWLEELKKN